MTPARTRFAPSVIGAARWFPFLSLWLGLGFVVNTPVIARDEGRYAHGDIEEVVTIGTRASARAASDAAVPVDMFTLDDLESVNSSDMVDVINTIVPSFNVTRQPISDGSTFIRPVSLRGLDSHHSLVLVNGKRRHRAALMQLNGFGAHGPDVGSIPSVALQSVETLRDSAAAQYGSDAIAGVINFNLRENRSGYELRGKYGGYTEGDGEEVTVEANAGFALGSEGFISISGQYSDTRPSSRSQPYDIAIGSSGLTPLQATQSRLTVDGVTWFGPDAFTYTYGPDGTIEQVLPGSDGIPDDPDTRFADNFTGVGGDREFDSPAQIWGQPEREQALFFVNAALPVSEVFELYGFGNYSWKDQSGGFFYRRPGVSQLLPLRLADGSIYDPRAGLYPAGFTPQFSGKVIDYSMVGGLRGELGNGLRLDLSVSYGSDEIRYRIANTLNPSLGPETPTSFRPGDLINDELAVNADFSLPVELGFAGPLNAAFGFEYRRERYTIEEGDPLSFAIGPYAAADPFNFEITRAEVDADPDDDLTVVECRIPGLETVGSLCPAGDPIHNTVPVGSNGFPGYAPEFASRLSRNNYAGYIDLEMDLTDELLVNGLVRFDHFTDFGDVVTWKLATRYRLTDYLNLRGSVGSGFRAPTPGQISTTNVSTRVGPSGLPMAEGVYPAEHPVSALFGARPLDAEDSMSYSLGFAAEPLDGLSLTLDYYHIRLDDRIVLSSQFAVGPGETAQLEALGVPGANTISQVRFFTNDVDSKTRGVDLSATFEFDGFGGNNMLHLAGNYNETRLVERGRFVDAEAQFDVENGAPDLRAVASLRHSRDRLDLLLRGRYYGDYENTSTADLAVIQKFGAEFMVDAEATLHFGDRFSLKAGARNLFDIYPERGEFESCCGRIYRSDSVVPWQGTFLYLQLQVSVP